MKLIKIIMKINTSQEKDKRIQHLNAPKSSFLSMSPKKDLTLKSLLPKNTVKRYDTLESSDMNKVGRQKNVEDQGFTNIFADDTQSTRHYSKRQNYLSSENLRVSFKGKQNGGKRQSQNIHQTEYKTPPNSLCDKKIVITKSASNLTKPNQEFLYIKSDNLIKETEKEEDTAQLKQLSAKIQEIKAFNQQIQSQNIQLRLEKLFYNSESREVLSLRKQINELKRKIQKLKAENVRSDEYYYEYYPVNREQKKTPGSLPFYSKQTIPRTSSNLQAQYPSAVLNSYDFSQNSYQLPSSPLAKSKVQEKAKLKRVVNHPSDEKAYMAQSTYKIHQDKDPNIIRIQIRK